MLTRYVVSHPDQPHLMLFVATDLHALALALSAQPDRQALDVYANDGSFNRPLTAEELAQIAVDETAG